MRKGGVAKSQNFVNVKSERPLGVIHPTKLWVRVANKASLIKAIVKEHEIKVLVARPKKFHLLKKI